MKYLNFDNMLAESRHQSITIRIYGEEFSIPDRIPALLVLELMRYDESEAVPAEALLRAAVQLFGEERTERWLKRDGISLQDLATLVESTFKLIGGTSVEGQQGLSEDGAGPTPKN